MTKVLSNGMKVTQTQDHFSLAWERPQLNILQVTDLHVGLAGKETCKSIRAICDQFPVDLVVCTGDFYCRNGLFIIEHQIHYMEKYVGAAYPWTFAWGNHDHENFWADDGSFSVASLDHIEQMFAECPNCLYIPTREYVESYPGPGPEEDSRERVAAGPLYDETVPVEKYDGFYGGNFAIEIQDPEAERPVLDLYILNSRRWHHLPPKVMNWMRDRVGRSGNGLIPGVCFYHVPNYAFEEIWERQIARGIKREAVCYEYEDGRIHEFFKSLGPGTIKACFVGHDHVNDYAGLLDGILYAYGRKTGMGSYGCKTKEAEPGEKAIKIGATLITVDLKGDSPRVTHQSVFEDGTTWTVARH